MGLGRPSLRKIPLGMTRLSGILAIVLAVLILCLAGAAWRWSKAPYAAPEASAIAQKFIQHLQTNEYEQAYAMSLHTVLTGKTPVEFEAFARANLCQVNPLTPVTSGPFQSNGNRLRRQWRGQDPNMPEITIEFTGQCLLGVTLRYQGQQQWLVYKYASHAG
jgi:hypothetical protein